MNGNNPGKPYLRIALVYDPSVTEITTESLKLCSNKEAIVRG